MGFGRDETVDSAGFRGTIPDNTSVAVLVIDSDGKQFKMKNGNNAGKIASVYRPVFEVLDGKYKGARIYGDVWCNVEPSPTGGDPVVFGSHKVFCDLCDATKVMDTDGESYPVAANEEDVKSTCLRFVGKMVMVTVGTNSYKNKKDEDVTKNTVKGVGTMPKEAKKLLVKAATEVQEKVAKWQAKKALEQGATGFEDTAGPVDDDDDDEDLPF